MSKNNDKLSDELINHVHRLWNLKRQARRMSRSNFNDYKLFWAILIIVLIYWIEYGSLAIPATFGFFVYIVIVAIVKAARG